MDSIPPGSYGPLIETTMRIITWNVWGRYGPWQDRETAIAPRRGGAGHPVQAALLGTRPVTGTYPSDHYAVQASLRY